MRIAILGRYPLDTERLGGVEVAIVYVQRELLKMPDVELHIITCKETLSWSKVLRQGRLTVTYLPRKSLGRLTRHVREVRSILSVLRDINPDVVHAHSTGFYAGAALASEYPAVITVHGIVSQEAKLLTDWPSKMRAFLDSRYERSVVRRAQHLMVITPYVQEVFADIFSGEAHLVENACDERFFEIERWPVSGRLSFAGPVVPRKGVLPLLKALRLVREQVPFAHLRVAGATTIDPAYYQACQAFVRDAALDGAVTFMGHLPQEEVLQEYATSAAFILPSFQETAPMVIEQAMAAGVPSVSTRAGGVPWMLEDGVTGLTLPVPQTMDGDPQALAEAILRILQDGEGAERMGRQAKSEAEKRFRPAAVARRTFQVYRQVAGMSG